jgi:hypothetical protein
MFGVHTTILEVPVHVVRLIAGSVQRICHKGEAIKICRVDVCPGPYEEGDLLERATPAGFMQHGPIFRRTDTPIRTAAYCEKKILQYIDADRPYTRRPKQDLSRFCIGKPPPGLIHLLDDGKLVVFDRLQNDITSELCWDMLRASLQQCFQDLSFHRDV